MGGDHGASVVVPAAIKALSQYPNLCLVLVGDKQILQDNLQPYGQQTRLQIQHAAEQVAMDEAPIQALRNKKNSSMRVAIDLVKKKQVSACVSAGNTGALMAIARLVLATLPHIERPAIISTLPTSTGHTHMLDLGANINSRPQHLLQFAVMGSVLSKAVDNINSPKVALLNIGTEASKGNKIIQKAAVLLEQAPINYIGFIEGNDIYAGKADVVVCDGFAGNIALKASEGVAKMIAHYTKEAFSQNLFTRLVALIAQPVFKKLRQRTDPRRYNGASLLGLQGIVIKSHGSADVLAFVHAIQEAIHEVEKNIPEQISDQLNEILGMTQAGIHS